MKHLSIIVVLLLIFSCPFALSGEIYTWIDENGVKHFTSEPPPPGATIVKEDAEIPYDAEKDRERKESDKQYLNNMEQKRSESEKKTTVKAPPAEKGAEKGVIQEDDDTWHQDRVEKRERIKDRHENNRNEEHKVKKRSPK
ncbi:DUF4124 domain-containing protein [Thermodesulfobacteriota bacterium]